jgi:hypothetical protein
VAAFALAWCTYAATAAASAANGEWQDAVRAEARHTSATLENIRKVYEDDAPLVLSITATLVRTQELERRADAGSFVGVLAAAERETARVFLDTFRRQVPDSPVTRALGTRADPEVVARTRPFGAQLAALQGMSRQHADAAAAAWSAGDVDAARVRHNLWGMVAGALVVLAGFAVRDRLLRTDPTGLPDLVVGSPPMPAVLPDPPGPGGAEADRSPLVGVVLAVLAVVVAALQIDASTTENRSLAAAAQGANRVGTVAVGSGPREAFAVNGQQLAVLMQQRADDVVETSSAAPAGDRAVAQALAAADLAAAARISAVVADLATPPTTADGLDALGASAVSASVFDRDAEQRAQVAAANAAQEAGARSDGLVLALLMLTLAANAIEIGHSIRPGAAGGRFVRAGWALVVVAVLLTINIVLWAE